MDKIRIKDCIPKSNDRVQTYANDNESSKYYGTHKWHALRASYLREHPLCEECLKNGLYVCSQEVHHIIPFMSVDNEEARMNLLLNRDNLMALCYDCHKAKHKHKRPWKQIHKH